MTFNIIKMLMIVPEEIKRITVKSNNKLATQERIQEMTILKKFHKLTTHKEIQKLITQEMTTLKEI